MKFTIRTKSYIETKTPITATGPSLKEITQTSHSQPLGTYSPFRVKKIEEE